VPDRLPYRALDFGTPEGGNRMKSIAAFVALGGMGIVTPTMASADAGASSTTGHLDIRLEIVPGCTFANGADTTPSGGISAEAMLDFGQTSGDSTGLTEGTAAASGDGSALSVVCSTSYTGTGAPTLTVDAGSHATGNQRYMLSPSGKTIAYMLYQDQARSRPYDPATASQLLISTAGTAAPIRIYGRVASVTGLEDGLYTDTVTLMLTY
jgi:spore coat protein U-like protein